MKKLICSLLLVISTGIFTTGCLKDNSNTTPSIDCEGITATAPAGEVITLQQRLDSLGIPATQQDPHGFFYSMDSSNTTDSAVHATPCSNVAITYSIARLGDTIFEKSDSVIAVSLPYTNVLGLKAAIPLMKKGAAMTLYLPPSLAYGVSGYKTIPGNTYVTFTIKLYDFSN